MRALRPAAGHQHVAEGPAGAAEDQRVQSPFVGHAVCDTTEWLNGLSSPTSESYHPNRTGHASGYLPLARQVLG